MHAIKYFYILVLCSFIFVSVKAQTDENTALISNQELFENAQKKSFRIIEDRIILSGSEKVYYFRTEANEEISDFFISGIRRYLNNYKIITVEPEKSNFSIFLRNIKLKIIYTKIKSGFFLKKEYNRQVNYAFDMIIKDSTESEVYSNSISEKFEDTLKYEDISYAESGGYSFTRGELPDESLLEKLLIPGIVVISSAVAVILFFIIRNK